MSLQFYNESLSAPVTVNGGDYHLKVTPKSLSIQHNADTSHGRRCGCTAYSCKTVSSVDALFKYFVANSYVVQVPVECLLMYTLIDPHLTSPVIGHAFVWLIFNFAQTAVISVAATNVNTQVER